MQREEPVAFGGRPHGKRYQADVRFGYWRWPKRQLFEVQLTSGCYRAVSLLRRLLPRRANSHYRPTAVLRGVGLADSSAAVVVVRLMPTNFRSRATSGRSRFQVIPPRCLRAHPTRG